MKHNHPVPAGEVTDPVARAEALIAEHRATLDHAERLAMEGGRLDARCTLARVAYERRNLDLFERSIRPGVFMRESAAEHALAMLGRNGRAPAIADVLREARGRAA